MAKKEEKKVQKFTLKTQEIVKAEGLNGNEVEFVKFTNKFENEAVVKQGNKEIVVGSDELVPQESE